MRSKYYWICLFSLPLFAALITTCGNRDTARISLTVKGAPDSTEVVVSRLAMNEIQVLDTVYTSNGKVTCGVPVYAGSPEFIYLSYGNGENVSLLLQNREKVSVTADWAAPGKVEIRGSEESVLMQEVDSVIKAFNAEFDRMASELAEAEERGGQAEVTRLKRELGSVYVKCKQNAIKYVYSHPKSMSVIPVLYMKTSGGLPVFSQTTDAILMERVYDSLKTVYPASPYLVSLADEVSLRLNAMEIQNRMAAAEAVDFPEIVLNDVNGQQQSLTALKGKVIILMFWDASNVEQRVYNTDLKILYERYHRDTLRKVSQPRTGDLSGGSEFRQDRVGHAGQGAEAALDQCLRPLGRSICRSDAVQRHPASGHVHHLPRRQYRVQGYFRHAPSRDGDRPSAVDLGKRSLF